MYKTFYQQCGIAKRFRQCIPLSRDWRRLALWQANWKSDDPELTSFGWSSSGRFKVKSKKLTTTRRRFFQTVKHNLKTRTKKDGCGTWAPEDHDPTKRMKFSYEFAARDFTHAVFKHAEQFGTTIPEQQWIVHDFGLIATELFLWGAAFGRSEKSHMVGVRGFEAERDLALVVMNQNFENIVFNIDYVTSTWYFDTAAPHGKQRAIDELVLGERLLNEIKP